MPTGAMSGVLDVMGGAPNDGSAEEAKYEMPDEAQSMDPRAEMYVVCVCVCVRESVCVTFLPPLLVRMFILVCACKLQKALLFSLFKGGGGGTGGARTAFTGAGRACHALLRSHDQRSTGETPFHVMFTPFLCFKIFCTVKKENNSSPFLRRSCALFFLLPGVQDH
jgi:hypothetical protein